MALRGTLTHWKTRLLAQELSVSAAHALGLLEALWHTTSEDAPSGNVGRLSNSAIAMQMFTDIDPDRLIAALIKSKHLDEHGVHRLIVHDWDKHADYNTKRKVSRRHDPIYTLAGDVIPKVKDDRPATTDDASTTSHDESMSGHDGLMVDDDASSRPYPGPDPDPGPDPELKPSAPLVAGSTESNTQEALANLCAKVTAEMPTPIPPPISIIWKSELDTAIDFVACRIHARHPQVRRDIGTKAVAGLVMTILRKKQLYCVSKLQDAKAYITKLDQRHEAMCQTLQWINDGGEYAKALSNWLAPTKDRYEQDAPRNGNMQTEMLSLSSPVQRGLTAQEIRERG